MNRQAKVTDALERKIVAALESDNMTADQLSQLIITTNTAIAEAESAAAMARESAFDPGIMPDPAEARLQMEDAIFRLGRLRTLLPRLHARHEKALAAEARAVWESEYKVTKDKINAAAKKWARYPALIDELIGIINTAELDREVSRVNGTAPDGEDRRLRGVELTARDLDGFTRDIPSIAENLQLPEFEKSRRMAWPPPKPSLAAMYATSMTAAQAQADPRRYTADWAAAVTADNARRAENERRWQREEEERQATAKREYEKSLQR